MIDRRIFHIKSKLSEDVGRVWWVQTMADEAGMSGVHFRRLFKKEIGTTPKSYLEKIRFEKAFELLMVQNSWISLKEVARAVGLASEAALIRLVRKHVDLTPTELRNRGTAEYQLKIENACE